jgi:hypothetical protein
VSSNTLEQMKRIYDEALNLAATKNTDYGDAWRDQGWRGNLSRVFEKAKRLRTVLWRSNVQPTAVRETVRETAVDMINTLTFFVINLDAGVEWGDEAPFALASNPMAPPDYPWHNPNGGVLPSPETLARLQEELNPFTDTSPGGVPAQPLPVRVPGEEVLEDEAPIGKPERKKPSPSSRTLPRQR